MADCQFAALVCGADPYRIVQTHWHASPIEQLLEKLGVDWRAKKADFEAYVEGIKQGATPEQLYDPRLRITSGPGFQPIRREVIPPPPAE
jgi:heterodisulfide reductase subunit B